MDPEEFESIAIEAGLWFRYGKSKRNGISSATTFDAVLAGERVSTTRFARWPGHNKWIQVVPGDLVKFWEQKGNTGRDLIVRVTSIQEINLWTCDRELLEEWSRCEGWLPEKGRALGGELGVALWFKHDLVWPRPELKPESETSQSQMSLF